MPSLTLTSRCIQSLHFSIYVFNGGRLVSNAHPDCAYQYSSYRKVNIELGENVCVTAAHLVDWWLWLPAEGHRECLSARSRRGGHRYVGKLKQRFHLNFKKKKSKNRISQPTRNSTNCNASPLLLFVLARYPEPTTRTFFLDARSAFHLLNEIYLELALGMRCAGINTLSPPPTLTPSPDSDKSFALPLRTE